MMHHRLYFGVVVVALGCGGQVATVDAGAGDGAVPDARADAPADSAVVDCNALRTKIDALILQARTCIPFANSPQCSHVAAALCCPVSITADRAPELETALSQFSKQCGSPACPGSPCVMAPSKMCLPSGPGMSQSGVCQ